jgi:hypothetical protein
LKFYYLPFYLFVPLVRTRTRGNIEKAYGEPATT